MTAAGAEVHVTSSAAELGNGPLAAELLVYHLDGEGHGDGGSDRALDQMAALADRLPAGAKVVVMLPRGDLVASVAAMRAHQRVASVLALDHLRVSDLTAMAARLLVGDIFGLDKVLPWGARVHSLLVGDYPEKLEAVRQISSFAAEVGLRRFHRDRIERCCDEMMMNAIYDAPAIAAGVPVVLPRAKARLAAGSTLGARLKPDPITRNGSRTANTNASTGASASAAALTGPPDRAVVEFGCDGQRFAVAVRDRHGRFERDVLLRYLHKCLHSRQPIDDKPGGAGLGLYFMSRSASALMFNLLPGTATECICLFDLEAPRAELDQIGVFQERVDENGRLAPHPTRVGHPIERRRSSTMTALVPRLPLAIDGVRAVAAATALFLLGLAALTVGLPRLYGARAAPPAAIIAESAACERWSDEPELSDPSWVSVPD